MKPLLGTFANDSLHLSLLWLIVPTLALHQWPQSLQLLIGKSFFEPGISFYKIASTEQVPNWAFSKSYQMQKMIF